MIRVYGDSASGVKVCSGYYAIDPSGHLIVLPPHAPLKDGWRLATTQDLEPADAPVEAVVESISIDAPLAEGEPS